MAVRDNGSDASPFSNVEIFAPLKPFDEWPAGLTKDKLTEELEEEFSEELPGIGFNFSQYIQDNVEEALSGVKGANSDQNRWTRSLRPLKRWQRRSWNK